MTLHVCQSCINGLLSFHSEYLTFTRTRAADTNDAKMNMSWNEKRTAAKYDQGKYEDEQNAKELSLSVSRFDKDRVCTETVRSERSSVYLS